MSILRPFLCTLLGLAGLCSAAPAMADDGLRLNVDWAKLEPAFRYGPAALLPPEMDRIDTVDTTKPKQLLGGSPRLSLVARDWGDSQRLVGRLALVDQMRPTRSSRMIVTRLRIADGAIVPFAQVGLGEWRVDTTVLPTLPGDRALAAQLGAGFELQMSADAVLALETDWTLLDERDDVIRAAAQPTLWGALLATRARF
jgi:hypothetical protein